MDTSRSTATSARRLAALVAAAAIAIGACEADDSNQEPASPAVVDGGGEPAVDSEGDGVAPPAVVSASPTPEDTEPAARPADPTPPPASEPLTDPADAPPLDGSGAPTAGDAPAVHAVASAHRSIVASEVEVAGVVAVAAAAVERPSAATVAEWIAALTQLEGALDAEAIRALGDDPVLEAVAAPIDDLDRSVQRVIELLDPPSGSPDLAGALLEAQAAITRWEAAAPAIEEAWAEAVARWTAEWELAVGEWELAWADAVTEWELAWADAVAEWELAWTDAVAEWELAWADAVAEWELAWADAVAEWQQAWEDAVDEWSQQAGGGD